MIERRAHWIAALVVLVASVATMTEDPIGVFNDDGIYLLTAKALAEGQGYVYPHLPGTPPAIHYPPVWPVLLAAVWKVAPAFPANIPWFKLINPVILALAAAGATIFGRRVLGLPTSGSLVAVLAATVSVPVLLLTSILLSEPLFLALLLPSLWASERMVRDGGTRRTASAAALLALLVMTRTLGGVVGVASVVLLVRERRWRDLTQYLGLAMVLLLPWQLFVWGASRGLPEELHGSYGPYLEWVAVGYRDGGWPFLGEVLAKNVGAAWVMLGVFVAPLVGGVPRHLTAALAAAAFVFGLVLLVPRGRAPVTALALAGYLAVALAWPYSVERFIWVIWPLAILVTVSGAWTCRAWLVARGRPRAAFAVLGAVGLLVVSHTIYNVRGLGRGWTSRASGEMTVAGIRLVRHVNDDRSLDGKLLAAELAPMLALYTGHRVLPVEILTPREHVVKKTPAEQTAELERIDRQFRPDAYVVMHAGPFYAALSAVRLDSGRTVVDVSPPGTPVRTLQVQVR